MTAKITGGVATPFKRAEKPPLVELGENDKKIKSFIPRHFKKSINSIKNVFSFKKIKHWFSSKFPSDVEKIHIRSSKEFSSSGKNSSYKKEAKEIAAAEAKRAKTARKAAIKKQKARAKLRKNADKTLNQISAKVNCNSKAESPRGLPNFTGANCYMNSVDQLLANNLTVLPEAQSLLAKKLQKNPGETLAEFEERLLGEWCPLVPDASFEDRIRYKWSFLLLLQTMSFEKNKRTRNKALKLHHRICFGLGLHPEFNSGAKRQKDAAIYSEMWHDLLDQLTFIMTREVRAVGADNAVDSGSDPLKQISIPLLVSELPQEPLQGIENKVKKHPIHNQIKNLKLKRRDLKRKELKEKERRELKALDVRIRRAENLKLRYERRLFLAVQNRELIDGREMVERFFSEELINFDFEDGEDVQIAYSKPHLNPIPGHEQLAKTFTIQFRRFRYDEILGHEVKLNNNIDCSNIMTLDLQEFLKNPEEHNETTYEMNGFTVHRGNCLGGHFYSYVKRDGNWFKCNDNTITGVENPPFHEAYICSYIRRDLLA